MNQFDIVILCVAAVAVVLAAIMVLWMHRRTRRTMLNLNLMLDAAIQGNFTGHSFDETLQSAVESKLAQYLSASAVSARNLSAEKSKIQELIADISHQTKTPIANILLYAQLLGEQNIPAESRGCVDALQAQAEKLSFLITSLIKLSRLETGILTLHPARHEIQPMLEKIGLQLALKAEGKQIALMIEPTPEQAVFDPKWTSEALCNFVDNAIKYTPPGGSVLVSVTAYDLFCRIDVADSGIGIAEQEQAKIFTRFYRSQAASESEGVGIGLYLARQILSGQGGYVKLASAPGKGSVFSVFLPREG